MKTIFTLLMLPVIILVCFLSGKLYINNQYFISYTLVMTSFLAVSLWINHISTLLQKQRA